MECRHLKYFVTVAEKRSFSRAAVRLHVSQPAISRQIKDLEDELGVVLLIRNERRAVGLSPAGETFLVLARNILKQVAEAVAAMKRFHHPGGGRLVLGFDEAIVIGMYVAAIAPFVARHPNVELKFLELTPQAQIEALRSRRIDLGFVGMAYKKFEGERDFKMVITRSVTLAAVLPDTHPLAGRPSINLNEIAGENFIGFAEETNPGRLEELHGLCQKAGFTPTVGSTADSVSAIFAFIATGKGVGLLPEIFSQLSYPHIVFVRLNKPVPKAEAAVLYRESDKDQRIADLIEAVTRYYSRHPSTRYIIKHDEPAGRIPDAA